LTIPTGELRIPPIPAKNPRQQRRVLARQPESMSPSSSPQPPPKINTTECKHPRVKIVAREEDSEFVECMECGEVFESSEFKDMNIEETKLKES
jgi:hypothetical protein